MRLNVFLPRSGVCSRRKAGALIKEGKVKINGETVKEPWFDVAGDDAVEIGGSRLKTSIPVYIVFYKPKGVITTLKDKFASKTVNDYIPLKFKGVFPVGRLDKNSEGLLILTNDGNLSFSLTHPKFGIEKEYSLKVEPKVLPDDLRRARRGLNDEGDFLKVEKASIDSTYNNKTVLRVVVREGKKRHLRRLFNGLGFKVTLLKRIRIAGLRLENLKPGELKIVRRSKFIAMLGIKQ